MKKGFLLAAVALMPAAAGAEYGALTFRTSAGSTHVADISGLEMTVADGNLTLSGNGSTAVLSLSDLVSMEFTNDATTAIDAISGDEGESINVYSIDGVSRGKFSSIRSAMESLPAGVYIAVASDGLTCKIAVK